MISWPHSLTENSTALLGKQSALFAVNKLRLLMGKCVYNSQDVCLSLRVALLWHCCEWRALNFKQIIKKTMPGLSRVVCYQLRLLMETVGAAFHSGRKKESKDMTVYIFILFKAFGVINRCEVSQSTMRGLGDWSCDVLLRSCGLVKSHKESRLMRHVGP